MDGRVRSRVSRCHLEHAKRFHPRSGASLMAGRARSRVPRCRLEQAKRFHPRSGASLMAGRARSRVPRCHPDRAKQLPHLNGANLMADQACNQAVQCRLPARPRAKRAVLREKEGKAPTVSLAGHHQEEVERPLQGAQPEVEHLHRELSAARSSHNTERDHKERHGQDHNNSSVICNRGSGNKMPEPLFFYRTSRCGIRCSGVCVKRRAPHKAPYSNSAICTAFNAAPLSN